MKLKRSWAFVSIVVLPKLLFCFEIRTAFFKVANKHLKIGKCALEILNQAEYSSAKLHKSGFCEGIKGSLNISSEAKEFAYFKMLSLRTVFRPPKMTLINFPLSFSDLEQKKRSLTLVKELKWNMIKLDSGMVNDTSLIHELVINTEDQKSGFYVNVWQSRYRKNDNDERLDIDPFYFHSRCDREEYPVGKKTIILMNFPSDLSLEVTVSNLTSCVFNLSTPLQTLKFMSIKEDKVFSIIETYDER